MAPSELADGETSAIRNSYWVDGETSGPMWYLSVAVAAFFFFFLCCTVAVAALNILDLCLGAALYDYVICLIIRNLFTLETLTWGGQES